MTETNRRTANSVRRTIGNGLAALAFVAFAQPASSQAVAPATSAVPKNAPAAVPFVESSPAMPQKPGKEGISIHGHWTLNVVNRDGTIAEHRDFENALQVSQASEVLTRLLLGSLLPQTFTVALSGPGNVALLYPSGQSCARVLGTGSTVSCVDNLVQGTAHISGAAAVVLKGTFTATSALTIQTVATDIGTCPQINADVVTYSPAVCQATTSGVIPGSGGAGVGIYNFTAATIPDLPVAAGQSVVVTVAISFS